jgi:UDP-3-O-[3-hydroxymyristoyl] glucosamine N-acyltransferase
MRNFEYTLAHLAEVLSTEFKGDPNIVIRGIAPLQTATAGQISFLDNPKYRKFLATTQASVVILAPEMLDKCNSAAIISSNPYAAYAQIANLFAPTIKTVAGIHPTAVIGEGCHIAASVSIGPNVVIGDDVTIGEQTIIHAGCIIGERSTIGAQTILWPRVTVYHEVQIGNRVIIHSGVVIGSDGFGFAFHQGSWIKVPQIGSVEIHDDVEIGANTTIDRGALENTVIATDVKLDNQIQVGHNVHIGAHTIIAGGTGIAGSTSIGKYCRIGGMVGFAGHIEVTDQVAIAAMAGVAQSITEPGVYASGIPASPFQSWRRNAMRFHQLDAIARKVNQLERQLSQVKEEGETE